MFKKIFLSLSLCMSVAQAQIETINDISQVTNYVTDASWVAWDLDGTLFQFQSDIPFDWLTKNTKKVFGQVKDKAKKVISVTGSYSYLYPEIDTKLNNLDARFSKKDKLIVLSDVFKSFAFNGVVYSGLQSKGDAFVQYLKRFDEKDLPETIVFVDDTEKHIHSVAESMAKAFPTIKIICLHYCSK